MRAPGLRLLSALLIIAFVVAGLRVGTAWADGGVPPDMVRLKNGGMVRGTIVELVPGKEVTLVDVAGQTRKLPMSDVAYAGPAAGDPSAAPIPSAAPLPSVAPPAPAVAPPAPAVAPPPRGLRLLGNEPNLTYHVLAGSSYGTGMGFAGGKPVVVGIAADNYQRLCTAPCTTTLEPGSYTLGISRPDGPVRVAPALTLRGDEELMATYKSRSAARVGWLVGSLVAMGLGAVVAFTGKTDTCTSYASGGTDGWGQPILAMDCQINYPHVLLGTGIFTAGMIGLLVPLFLWDTVTITPTGR